MKPGFCNPGGSWPIFAENGEFTFIAMPLSGSENLLRPGCPLVPLLAQAAHKLGGLKGVGILVSDLARPFVLGGSQERGRRSGTENYPAVKAMSVACELMSARLSEFSERSCWRDSFEKAMLAGFPGLQILGKEAPRLWNTSMLLMPDYENLLRRKARQVGVRGFDRFRLFDRNGRSVFGCFGHGFFSEQAKRLVRVSAYAEQTEHDWMNLAKAFCVARDELDEDSPGSSVISL